jgi:hypothetical protein
MPSRFHGISLADPHSADEVSRGLFHRLLLLDFMLSASLVSQKYAPAELPLIQTAFFGLASVRQSSCEPQGASR